MLDEHRPAERMKLIKSGNTIEVLYYNSFLAINFKHKEKKERKIFDNQYVERRFRTVRREIMRLVDCNSDLDKFASFTFARPITDVSYANKQFNFFIKRLRRYLDQDFRYIAVIEFMENGRVHYHLLSDIPYVPNHKLAQIWENGHIKINKIDKVRNLSRYMSKYITKGLCDGRLYRKKKYFCSQNLKRPEVCYDHDALQLLINYGSRIKKVYSYHILTGHGYILYEIYKIIKEHFIKFRVRLENKTISNFEYSRLLLPSRSP